MQSRLRVIRHGTTISTLQGSRGAGQRRDNDFERRRGRVKSRCREGVEGDGGAGFGKTEDRGALAKTAVADAVG